MTTDEPTPQELLTKVKDSQAKLDVMSDKLNNEIFNRKKNLLRQLELHLYTMIEADDLQTKLGNLINTYQQTYEEYNKMLQSYQSDMQEMDKIYHSKREWVEFLKGQVEVAQQDKILFYDSSGRQMINLSRIGDLRRERDRLNEENSRMKRIIETEFEQPYSEWEKEMMRKDKILRRKGERT